MKSAANSLESLSKSELIAALQARELLIKNQLQEHNKQLAQRDNIITLLEEKLRLLRCQGYGARSEQRGNDPQADLFNEVDALASSPDTDELEAGSISTDNAADVGSEEPSTDTQTITY